MRKIYWLVSPDGDPYWTVDGFELARKLQQGYRPVSLKQYRSLRNKAISSHL